MNSAAVIQIELTPGSLAFLKRFETLPAEVLEGIRRGMDKVLDYTVSDIKEKRLSGKGPYPVAEGRLGQVSSQYFESLRTSPPRIIDENTVTGAIGTRVKYARIHEYGGVIKRTVKPGKVRLRTDRNGELLRNGNLAIFANKTHADSRVREVAYAGGGSYEIHIPARAPIGHGVADNAATFSRAIAREMKAVKEAMGL